MTACRHNQEALRHVSNVGNHTEANPAAGGSFFRDDSNLKLDRKSVCGILVS